MHAPLARSITASEALQMKPRLFIASSTEQLDVANAIQENLDLDAEATVWSQGLFHLSTTAIDSLLATLQASDFGVFVLGADDLILIRGQHENLPRDNVVFELGMFIGRLGRERAFLVVPRGQKKLHLPTDLLGITPAEYDPARSDGNLIAALGKACNQIRRAMAAIPQPSPSEAASPATSQLDPGVAGGYGGRWRLTAKFTQRWRNHALTPFDSITLSGDLYLVFPVGGGDGVGSLNGSLNVNYVHDGEPRLAEFLVTDRVTNAREHPDGRLTFKSERLSRHLIYDSGNLPPIDGFQPLLDAGTHFFEWSFVPTVRPPRCLQGGYQSSRSVLEGYLTKFV
ncbi:MAG TPA: nucleotide-binding protein [Longimicrobium sp.]|nr:nucleotide-binding protein [Longimicrobium sp.]